jgi:hypothetical protein
LAVVALTAGCGVKSQGGGQTGSRHGGSGSPQATPTPKPSSPSAASAKCVRPRRGAEHTTITLTNSDNKKALCVLPGVGIFVALHGTPKEFWAAVASSSAALQRRPNGALSLPVGVTGAFFVAIKPGTAKLTSTLRPCQAKPPARAVARCLKLERFSVTVKVPPAGPATS